MLWDMYTLLYKTKQGTDFSTKNRSFLNPFLKVKVSLENCFTDALC